MGLFCSSIHLRADDRQAVLGALGEDLPSVVSDSEDGWVSVYVEGLTEADNSPADLAARLSSRLGTAAFSLWVYDSDILRFWLHESGELGDEYDSWPGYFEGSQPRATGGKVDLLANYCAEGFGVRELRRALAADVVFADDLATRLAELLGIPQERVVTDYRDLDQETDALGGGLSSIREQLQLRSPDDYPAESVALVKAAAEGDLESLKELVQSAKPLNIVAPGPVPQNSAMSGLGIGDAQPEMTPLIAAVLHRQNDAAEILLDMGADPNAVHEAHGSAVHVAAGAGRSDLLELLLGHGGEPTRRNSQGQTPLDLVTVTRQGMAFIRDAMDSIASLGMDQDDLLDQIATEAPTTVELDRCEEILKSASTSD